MMSSEKWRLYADDESNEFYNECTDLHASNKHLMKLLRELLLMLKYQQVALDEQYLDTTVELLQSIVDTYTSLNSRTLAHELPPPSPAVIKQNIVIDTTVEGGESHTTYALSPESFPSGISNDVIVAKTRRCREKLWQDKITLIFMIHQLVNDMLEVTGDKNHLSQVFRFSSLFNDLFSMGSDNDKGIATSCKNTCPILLYPLRKLSVTRLLQIIAQKRAESACHSLAVALLENYKLYSQSHHSSTVNGTKHHHVSRGINRGKTFVVGGDSELVIEYDGDVTSSSENGNSSIEIYSVLTGHMTPPCGDSALPPVEKTAAWLKKSGLARLDWSAIEGLVADEQRYVVSLMNMAAQTSPQLLGRNGVKISKNTGGPKVCHSVRAKAIDYYQHVVWAEAGTHMEHHVLWWSSMPFGSLAPDESILLRSWLLNLSVSGFLTATVAPAVHNLADGLGCHVTATKWDQLFRHALVHGQRQGSDDKNKDVGKLFADLLHSLVTLSNDCETTVDWLSSPPLEELPLVEQIPILHRLDHSVHTTRLWAANKAKTLINTWKVDKFVEVSQMEVENCLTELRLLKMASHLDLSKVESQHVLVCAKMRTKLTAEVTENVNKLKKLPIECTEVMASVCRTFCLANLHMCFPDHRYWKRSGPLPDVASVYVDKYLDRALKPVLLSLSPLPIQLQQSVGGMTLRIMCEAWLDHIYTHRIKFSEWGAMQLLADFRGVPLWLDSHVKLPAAVTQTLLNHEVLRRCEGVGKLLLRKPGESVNMTGPPAIKHNQVGVNGTTLNQTQLEEQPSGVVSLPAEMFVPNQQQWLELRAPKPRAYTLCCSS